MKRQLLTLLALAAVFVCISEGSAFAQAGRGGAGGGRGGSRGVGFNGFRQHLGNPGGHGFRHGGRFSGFGDGFGLGFGGFYGGYGWDIAALYRELYGNLPHFALHPPVYYSRPVPRTYGYSPFAYPGYMMTPDLIGDYEPVEIINPHVPTIEPKQTSTEADKSAANSAEPQPLVVMNPFVTSTDVVAQAE